MRWLVRAGLALLALAVVLGGVLTARTLMAQPAAIADIALAEAPRIDAARAAEHLGAAIRFRTISTQAGSYDPAPFEALHAFLKATYPLTFATLTVERPAGHSLLMTWAGSDPALPAILLLAHQDVVPVEAGTEANWAAPPFDGVVRDGIVYGRGAMDNKNSVIAILEGVEALLARGFKPRRTVVLAFGHDEEVMGSGAAAMAAMVPQRLGKKAWFALDEGMAIVSDFPLTNAPVSAIGIAEKGYLSVRIAATGVGGHSSTPPRLTAVEKVAAALMAIDAAPFAGGLSDGPGGLMVQSLAPHLPFVERMALANLWLLGPLVEGQLSKSQAAAAVLRTTTAPTMQGGGTKDNVLPQTAWAVVNLRLHPRDSVASALAHLRAVTAGFEGVTITPEGTPGEPSPVSSDTGDAFALLASVAKRASGGAPTAPALVLGATDGRHYRDAAESVYRFTPMLASQGALGQIHGTDEKISVENVGRMAEAYAALIATGAK